MSNMHKTSFKEKTRLSYSATQFLKSIDTFLMRSDAGKGKEVIEPPIVKTKPFSGHTLKSKAANLFTLLPLKVVRKSTTERYYYQAQLNQDMRDEIEILHRRIGAIEDYFEEKNIK